MISNCLLFIDNLHSCWNIYINFSLLTKQKFDLIKIHNYSRVDIIDGYFTRLSTVFQDGRSLNEIIIESQCKNYKKSILM